jgi:transporter family protein
MDWITLTVLASFGWAAIAVLDKYFMDKMFSSLMIPYVMTGLFGVAAFLVAWIFGILEYMPITYIAWSLFAGLCMGAMVWFYFKAIQSDEISRVAPLLKLATIYVVIASFFIFDESFSWIVYIGIAALVIGSILISLKPDTQTRFKLNKAFYYMLFGGILLSAAQLITKHVVNTFDYWTAFSYIRLGVGLFVLPFFFYYAHLFKNRKEFNVQSFSLMSLSEVVNLGANLSLTAAFALGPVSLVKALGAVQVIFVFMLALFISWFAPKYIQEKMSPRAIFVKIVSIVLIIGGSMLVTLF